MTGGVMILRVGVILGVRVRGRRSRDSKTRSRKSNRWVSEASLHPLLN